MRYKRFFPVSHDFNFDPEFNRLCRECGLPGVRFWFQLLALLDKTENQYNAGKELDVRLFSGCCGTKPKMIWTSYRLLLDMKWITSEVDTNKNLIISAPNYMKYHRTQVPKSESNGVPPNLTKPNQTKPLKDRSTPSPKNVKGHSAIDVDKFLESLQSNPAYHGIDMNKEKGRMAAWLDLPKNKKRQWTKQFILNWLNKIDVGLPQQEGVRVCKGYVPDKEQGVKRCKAPSTKNGLCHECYQQWEREHEKLSSV
jgi:hypothetical protein